MLQNKIIYHIGGTGDTKTMNEFIQQHQLSSFIKYHGWVDNERKEKDEPVAQTGHRHRTRYRGRFRDPRYGDRKSVV